jgi:hypothetical protein
LSMPRCLAMKPFQAACEFGLEGMQSCLDARATIDTARARSTFGRFHHTRKRRWRNPARLWSAGIVSKRLTAPYKSGRCKSSLKLRNPIVACADARRFRCKKPLRWPGLICNQTPITRFIEPFVQANTREANQAT